MPTTCGKATADGKRVTLLYRIAHKAADKHGHSAVWSGKSGLSLIDAGFVRWDFVCVCRVKIHLKSRNSWGEISGFIVFVRYC